VNSTDPIACGLPHRPPFVFVGEVVKIEPGSSAECAKTFHADEPFFAGHFPGRPLVPGVILTEAMAQTAGLAAGQPGRAFHLTAIKMMKFLRPVLPGQRIVFAAQKTGGMGGLFQFAVSAKVEEVLVADGAVILNEVQPG
jgi:3-hydroxyacyl-[acyl-carrier-protein] dehydratase